MAKVVVPPDPEARCAGAQLTIPQWNTLVVIREHENLSVKELAEALKVSAPSASSMVERLVEMGFVNREPSRVDRREVRISLSAAGNAGVDAMEGQLLQSIVELLERIGSDVAQQWVDVYAKIQEVLDQDELQERHATSERVPQGSRAV
jgi:DNA-binding MarR family transcriptional regulator